LLAIRRYKDTCGAYGDCAGTHGSSVWNIKRTSINLINRCGFIVAENRPNIRVSYVAGRSSSLFVFLVKKIGIQQNNLWQCQ